ncbi:MAG: molybdopterin-dependent oxidoreductase [Myxococcales bacterium]|nr:molybdopterin-dependent oxidoreductase [Myxococcales bacterium]
MAKHAIATCVLCEASCGITVEVDGGVPRAVRGDPDDSMSQGFVCPKVVGMIDLHQDTDRLRAPVVRDGKDFREVSWDEALERAAHGIRRVRREHGADAVAVYQGNPTAHNLGLLTVGQLVLRTLGTKNLYSASTADQIPHMRAAHEMFGHLVFMPVPDVDRTDHWLIVGGNPAVSNGSIMTAPDVKRRIEAIRARGGSVTVVDPRRTETARLADRHVFIRPGGDPWFFLAMIHVVFEEGLARPGKHLHGLADLRELARPFTPEVVEGRVGMSPAALRETVRAFCHAHRAACYVRVGTCHQEHGTIASWLAYAFAAVTGNLDREGGLMWASPAVELAPIADAFGLRGHGRFESRVRRFPETGGELPIAVLAEEIETPGRGQVRALITSAGNPVLSAPNGRRVDRALASLEHMVSVDGYINETTRHAHVILPPCSPLSRAHYDLALGAYAVRNGAKWVDPPLPRRAGEKDDGEIFTELGLRIRLGARSKGPSALARRVISRAVRQLGPEGIVDLGLRIGPYGMRSAHKLSVKKLRAHPHGLDLGPLMPQLPGMLRTPSKKVELAPPAFAREVRALRESLGASTPGLVLIGRRELRSNNSWLHNSERLVKGRDRGVLLVHPDDARARGLADGARARVTTDQGTVVAVVKVSDEVMRGVVSLPHGWGHDRPGVRARVAAAHAGVSMNDLTDDGRLDRLTGNAAFNGVPVEVELITTHVGPHASAE